MTLNAAKRRPLEALDIVSFAILTIIVLLILFPFYTTVVTSFTPNSTYIRHPVQLFPQKFTLDNYTYVFEHLDILRGYQNTLFVVLIGTAISMSVSLCYAYGLAMDDYPGKKLAFIFILITMYFGGGLIPTYLLIKNLGLVNNKMAIVFLCGVSPFNIIIMKNSIQNLPASLIDAARVDGAGEFRVFWQIVIPLIKPTVVTFTLFSAVAYWNEWYWSMILLTKPATKTLQIMLRTVVNSLDAVSREALQDIDGVEEVFTQGLKLSAVVITMLPIMAVYPFLQKHFAAGILVGAVKM